MLNLTTPNGRFNLLMVAFLSVGGLWFASSSGLIGSPATSVAECDASSPNPLSDLQCLAEVMESCNEDEGTICFGRMAEETEQAINARLGGLPQERVEAAALRSDGKRRDRIIRLSNEIRNVDAELEDCDEDERTVGMEAEDREVFCGALLGMRRWVNVRMLESDILIAEGQ